MLRNIYEGLSIAAILVLAMGCKPSPIQPPSIEGLGIVHGQVVKGQESVADSTVAILSITDQGEALCTGTILDSQSVLTAAHCLDDHPFRTTVVFNRRIKNPASEDIRLADSYLQHPQWFKNRMPRQGDLAIVHFDGGLPDGYEPVTLAPADMALPPGTDVILVGFGVTNGLKEKGAGVLRQTETKVIEAASPSEIVTDGSQASVCFGDSGGPAFVRQGDILVQWGIASAVLGRDCKNAAVHTAIMGYENWIKSTVARLAKSASSR